MQMLAFLFSVLLNPRFVASDVTFVNIPEGNNWVIGTTLNEFFESTTANPFTTSSWAEFQAAWESKDEWLSLGTFDMDWDIVTSQEKANEFLEISGSLEVSFTMFSGDAHMTYAKETVMSSSDVSVIIKAQSAGRKQQMSIAETNMLELDVSGTGGLDEFKSLYGTYMIVGFEYGGEIIFTSTHSAKNSEDQQAIEGGLSISFEHAGFSITGSAEAEYEKSDVTRSVDTHQDWSIRPNAGSDASKAVVEALTAISMGDMADDPTLFTTLSTNAEEVLASEQLDPIKAIIVPLTTIKAVNNKYVDNPDAEDTVPFMTFLNGLYFEVVGLSKQLKTVEKVWYDVDRETAPVYDFGDWEHCLNHLLKDMQVINNMDKLINESIEYLKIYRDMEWNADVLSATYFTQITARGLRMQFDQSVMEPYREMLEAHAITTTTTPTTARPTPLPTPSPVEPCYAWHDVSSSDIAYTSYGGATIDISDDDQSRLVFEGTVKSGYTGCGSKPRASMAVFIDDSAFPASWERVRYTMQFYGHSACYSLFGDTTSFNDDAKPTTLGLIEDSVQIIDNALIYGAFGSEGLKAEVYRCDNDEDVNFFREEILGPRGYIRVQQSREPGTQAGLGFGLSCSWAKSSVRFSNIQVEYAHADNCNNDNTVALIPLTNEGNPTAHCDCLAECAGDCDYDDDCIGDLRCYQRSSGERIPPGCVGVSWTPDRDYCYDPAKTDTAAKHVSSRSLEIEAAQGDAADTGGVKGTGAIVVVKAPKSVVELFVFAVVVLSAVMCVGWWFGGCSRKKSAYAKVAYVSETEMENAAINDCDEQL